MSGGFCERHGPFDPPHEACPYCAMESGVSGPAPRGAKTSPSPRGGAISPPPPPPRGGVPIPNAQEWAEDIPTNVNMDYPPYGGVGETATGVTQGAWPTNEQPTQLQPDDRPGYGSPPNYGPPVYGGQPGYGGSPKRGEPSYGEATDYDEPVYDSQTDYGELPNAGQPGYGEDAYGQAAQKSGEVGLDEATQIETGLEAEVEVVGPLAFLLVQRPLSHRGQVITVLPGNVIGRRNADVIINDRKISRQHARINLEPPDDEGNRHFAIFDFGTPNGTYVNGERIQGRRVLAEDDEIRLGEHTFAFKSLF